jgi:hypothetical protein
VLNYFMVLSTLFLMELVTKSVKEIRYMAIYLRLKHFLQNGENFGPSVSRNFYNWLVPVVEK